MAESFSNFSKATLTTAINSTDLTIVLSDASLFPTANFYIVIDSENSNREIIYITSRSVNTLTVASTSDRGTRGTTASAHSSGANVLHGPLAHHVETALHDAAIYTHTQGSASSTWTINHNLAKFPSVTVIDSSDSVVEGDISYTNANSLVITFTASFSGKAYLN